MVEVLDDVMDDDRFAVAEQNLGKAAKNLPDISINEVREPKKERKASSVSLPGYVWSELRRRAGEEETPYNILIMKGLREIGFDIDDDDLIDPRKSRHQK